MIDSIPDETRLISIRNWYERTGKHDHLPSITARARDMVGVLLRLIDKNERHSAQVESAEEQTRGLYVTVHELAKTLQAAKEEAEELRRQGYPVGVLLRILNPPEPVHETGDEYSCADLGHRQCDGSHSDHSSK